MDRVITLLLALVMSAAAMFAWDRHQPISIPVLPFWHIALPASLAQQRDDAVAAATHAVDEQRTCLVTLRQQSAEISGLSDASARIMAKITDQLRAAANENDRLRAASGRVHAYATAIGITPIPGADRCAAWENADKTVKEAMQ